MSSLDALQTRAQLAQNFVERYADDEGVAIRIRATSDAGAVTSVTVTTATNIVAISANGGTETWDFATYSTVALLVDQINSSQYWEARVLDSIRTETTASQFVDGAITATSLNGVNYYDVLTDTSACHYLAARISYDRLVGSEYLSDGHRVQLDAVTYNVTQGGGADANSLRVYEWDPVNKTETIVWQSTPTSGSETTLQFNSGNSSIETKEGRELIVYLFDAASTTGWISVMGTKE